MKNYILLTALTLFLVSCAGKKKADGLTLANEVCECRQKVKKGMKFEDPEFDKIFKECSILQGENFGKISNDKPAEEAYNKRLNECMDEMINTMNSK
jgi:hypothetical protein